MAKASFKSGDKVEWESPGGHSVGKNLTAPWKIMGRKVASSLENLEHLVESDAPGGRAAHKPGSLKRA